MPGDADLPLSTFRQTCEARALELFEAPFLRDVLHHAQVEVPRLIHHDETATVLWMTDLGSLVTLSDYLRGVPLGTPTDEPAQASSIGKRIGTALAELHLAMLNPSQELSARFKNPDPPKSSEIAAHQGPLIRRMIEAYATRPVPDVETLSQRLGLEGDVVDARTQGTGKELVLSMGDVWPGSVLLGSNGGNKIRLALVDWEFFGATHPGAEIGALASHLHSHELEGAHSTQNWDISPGRKRLVTTRSEACGVAVVEAYMTTAGPGITRTPTFRRRVLCAYGRESLNAADFRKEWLGDEGKSKSVDQGARALRAAGGNEAEMSMGELGEQSVILRRLLGLVQV
jgi:aminoglycoside phosphotransferase (APT) family kinase protein